MQDVSSPKIGDMLQRKKLSATKACKAESVGAAVDRAVELASRLDNRATLEHPCREMRRAKQKS
jgi:hypothetical protein